MGKNTRFGYHYHYKHNPQGKINHHAYLILGTGLHTEKDCRQIDTEMVIYLPIYPEALVYRKGKLFDLRPSSLYFQPVQKDGKTIKRFRKIKDEKIIKQLRKIAKQMYPNHFIKF